MTNNWIYLLLALKMDALVGFSVGGGAGWYLGWNKIKTKQLCQKIIGTKLFLISSIA